MNLLPITYADPKNPGQVCGRTEVERREVYMKKLDDQFMEPCPMVIKMVTNCLHNSPEMRPSAEKILEGLQLIHKESGKKDHVENLGKIFTLANVSQTKETGWKRESLEVYRFYTL